MKYKTLIVMMAIFVLITLYFQLLSPRIPKIKRHEFNKSDQKGISESYTTIDDNGVEERKPTHQSQNDPTVKINHDELIKKSSIFCQISVNLNTIAEEIPSDPNRKIRQDCCLNLRSLHSPIMHSKR